MFSFKSKSLPFIERVSVYLSIFFPTLSLDQETYNSDDRLKDLPHSSSPSYRVGLVGGRTWYFCEGRETGLHLSKERRENFHLKRRSRRDEEGGGGRRWGEGTRRKEGERESERLCFSTVPLA